MNARALPAGSRYAFDTVCHMASQGHTVPHAINIYQAMYVSAFACKSRHRLLAPGCHSKVRTGIPVSALRLKQSLYHLSSSNGPSCGELTYLLDALESADSWWCLYTVGSTEAVLEVQHQAADPLW